MLFQTLTNISKQGSGLTSISHAASYTFDIHSTFHRLRGSSGFQKWQKLPKLHPSISDSRGSSKIRSTISIKSISQITKQRFLTPPYVSPSTTKYSARSASWNVPSHRFHMKPSATSDKSPLHRLWIHIKHTVH